MTAAGRWLAAGAVAAAATVAARGALERRTPGGEALWTRRNHRGEPISLLEGPAVVAGLVAGVLASGARSSRSVTVAQVVAVVGAGAFGVYDDLAEDTTARSKGLRGHLSAALRGELTTGGLKVLGIGTTALAAAAIGSHRTAPLPARVLDIGLDGALIAASANLVNLLDLRPGRALKASVVTASAMTVTGFGAYTAPVLGASLAAAPTDLAEADMLGDGGANALGALLGTALALSAPRPVRAAALTVVVALTVASEKVSFSQVIADTPWLAAVDAWGRRAAVQQDGAARPDGAVDPETPAATESAAS